MVTFIFQFIEGLRIALRAIATHKMRAVLTTLGIVIGIVSVTAMFTVINGLERGLDNSMAMLGTDVLHVQKFRWGITREEMMEMRSRPNLDDDLVEPILTYARYASAAAPVMQSSRNVNYRDRSLSGVFLQASTADYARVHDIELTYGRFYNDTDNHSARQVAVIGVDVAEGLFPSETPLGKSIRIGGHRFEVIGVLERQGKFLGLFSFDTQIQMPINTFKKLFGSQGRSVNIEVKVAAPELMDAAEDELVGLMRTARGLDAFEQNDFSINRQEAFREQIGQIKNIIYAIGILLTALALLVGGIGVMNIMFVSVKERTKEIGIRRAVGAKRYAILTQFLIEAIAVCALGGLIGILISLGVTQIINSFFTAYLSIGTVVLAISICVGIGIVFGFIPARSAAYGNTIEALRYE